MTPITEKAFQNILDCFTGADGGIAFINTKLLIEEIDKRAEEQTPDGHAASQVIDVVLRFSKLIDVANAEALGKKE